MWGEFCNVYTLDENRKCETTPVTKKPKIVHNEKLYLIEMTEKYIASSICDDKCLREGKTFVVSDYSESSYKLVNEYEMYIPKKYCKILKEFA